jgi:methylation protein EvaC
MEFLDLGRQPLANGFLTEDQVKDEYFYDLKYQYDPDIHLVSMVNKVEPTMMFNDKYPYHTSGSATMRKHFKDAAKEIPEYSKVLEIGSNDGAFICNINKNSTPIAVEPCGNFANITSRKGIPTYEKFWSPDLAYEIVSKHGFMDFVYSANCMCHIPDIREAFFAVRNVLTDEGIFIFEDPSLLDMMRLCSYDELYDEHVHMFSITALEKLLNSVELYIYKVEDLPVHGGSNRIWAGKERSCGNRSIDKYKCIERYFGLDKCETYELFGGQVERSKALLIDLLNKAASMGKTISYGATSKSTTIFNYCGIGPDILSYITDTTLDKQGKLSPGMHIPIVSPDKGLTKDVECIFLGAWNYTKEIMKKEKDYAKGKKWITHVPYPRIIK